MLFLAVVLVALLVVKAAGSFFFNHVMAQPAVTTFAPMPQVLEAKAPPVKWAQNLAAGLKPSQSRFKTNPASAAKALDSKLLGSPADLSRSAPNRSSQPTPPDLTGVPTDVPSEGVGSVHPGSSNVLLTPRLTPEESAPVQVGGRLKEPHLAFKVDPIYPAMARQTNVEGEVVIHAVIDASGKPTHLKVVSGPTLLQDAALDSVRQWQYEPSYLDGEPVPAGIFIPVNFRLH